MSNEPYYELNTKDIRIIHNKREVKFLPHIHNSVEIIYLFSGIQHLIINEQTYILNTGEAVLIPPGYVHSCFRIDSEENNKYNKNAEFVSIIFKSQRIQEFKEFFDNYTFNQYKIYKNQIDDFMSQIFKYMIEDFSEIRQFFYCTLAVKKLINQLEPIPINNNNIKISNEYKIISYIEEHYRENITLDTLSKELYINKFTVSKIFSEQIGVNFRTYLGIIRSNIAAKLIRSTNDSLENISTMSGFSSVRTFDRTFYNNFRITPREYRKKLIIK